MCVVLPFLMRTNVADTLRPISKEYDFLLELTFKLVHELSYTRSLQTRHQSLSLPYFELFTFENPTLIHRKVTFLFSPTYHPNFMDFSYMCNIGIILSSYPLRFGGRLYPAFYFGPPIGGRLNTHSVF